MLVLQWIWRKYCFFHESYIIKPTQVYVWSSIKSKMIDLNTITSILYSCLYLTITWKRLKNSNLSSLLWTAYQSPKTMALSWPTLLPNPWETMPSTLPSLPKLAIILDDFPKTNGSRLRNITKKKVLFR